MNQPNPAPWRRIYIDLPSDVDQQLSERARAAGKSKKAYLAELVTADARDSATTGSKKKGKQ